MEIDSAHFKKKTRQALDWNPHEHRKRRRPKHTCRRGLEIELKKIEKIWREAKATSTDRRRWRDLVVIPWMRWIKSGKSSNRGWWRLHWMRYFRSGRKTCTIINYSQPNVPFTNRRSAVAAAPWKTYVNNQSNNQFGLGFLFQKSLPESFNIFAFTQSCSNIKRKQLLLSD